MNTKEPPQIVTIPINQIKIINPRNRNRDKFKLVRDNIANVGLKKPIIVSMRGAEEENPNGGYCLSVRPGWSRRTSNTTARCLARNRRTLEY
jgi:hypothetical protein